MLLVLLNPWVSSNKRPRIIESKIYSYLLKGPATTLQIMKALSIGFHQVYPALHWLEKSGFVRSRYLVDDDGACQYYEVANLSADCLSIGDSL